MLCWIVKPIYIYACATRILLRDTRNRVEDSIKIDKRVKLPCTLFLHSLPDEPLAIVATQRNNIHHESLVHAPADELGKSFSLGFLVEYFHYSNVDWHNDLRTL
jgi:hypothetical protein